MLEKSQRNIFKVALQYLPDQILIYVYCKSKESMSNEGVKQKLLELQNEIVKTVEHSRIKFKNQTLVDLSTGNNAI